MTVVWYLGVGSNDCLTLVTHVCKHRLVAVDAVRVLITQDVTVTGQRQITVETGEVTRMPVVVHCLRVLGREYQLFHTIHTARHRSSVWNTVTCSVRHFSSVTNKSYRASLIIKKL